MAPEQDDVRVNGQPAEAASSVPPLERVIENAHEAFISIDEDGRIVGWNREAERTFGWSREAVLGERLRDRLIPAQYRDRHDAGLRRFLASGEGPLLNKRIEITALHRSGREIPVEMTISAVEDAGRWSFHAFVHDISERRRAGELQARLATLVEHSADAVVSRTAEGVVTSWNPAAERLYGYDAEEMIGAAASAIVPDDRADEERVLLSRVLRGEPVQAAETVRVTKEGRLLDVSLTISPIRDDAGRVTEVAIVARDISASKEAQRALAAAFEQLRQADELKSKLVAVASHEIRTPLTSVIGFATTLLDRWPELGEGDKLEFLQLIESQARRLQRLTDEVLTLSRLEAGMTESAAAPVDLELVAHDAVAELSLEVATTIVPGGASRALVDPGHAHQILLNLLSNAASYGAPPITVGVSDDDEWVVARVHDSGTGVPDEFVPHLFDAFTRALEHHDQHGTGLGLAIAKSLAELDGGELAYEPSRPRGSCFVLRLPRAA
jgi:PAS domain S-box-containing protein